MLKNDCPHIVIGTPGRILALTNNKALNLDHIKHFIIDACDLLLEELGKHEQRRWMSDFALNMIIDMRQDVQKIVLMTPQEKQVLMFSASNQEIRSVCKQFMRDVS